MANSVQGIDALGGNSSSQGLGSNNSGLANDPTPVSYQPRWVQALQTPNAAHTYSCFMLMLLALSNLGMGNINGSALAQSNLMDTEQAIQKNLVTISSFLSQLQQNSTADSQAYQAGATQTDSIHVGSLNYLADPNALNGLATTFYNLQKNGVVGAEYVNSEYADSMASFIQAFKEIFYANTNASAPTVASLSEIYNPNVFQNGQGFNLSAGNPNTPGAPSFWSQINSSFTQAGFNQQGYNVVGTRPSDKASLIQQYMFYKAQVSVDTGSISTVNGANGDIGKLVDFDPTSTDCDPFITQTLGLWNAFDVTESVNRSGLNANAITCESPTSGNLITMMLTGSRGQLWDSGSIYTNDSGADNGQVGLYGAFSYMAFNDYWSKNPAGNSTQSVAAPSGGPANWYPAEGFLNLVIPLPSWDWGSPIASLGNAQGDDLASDTTMVNGVQTNAGSATSAQSANMQELTANESSYVSIGQNLLQNLGQSLTQWSQNQISN
ncbi:MAG: hypothetical protein WCG10_06365 [Chlamydiota bacterium]